MFLGTSYYYFILAIQGFALFHAYKTNNFQKWYFIIIFIPVIGSLIYLYDTLYSRRNIESLGEGVKRLVSADYDVKRLERELEIADTVSNKLNLANAYLANGNYEKALMLYDESMKGPYANDADLYMKKLKANFLLKRYDETIRIGEMLGHHKPFDQAEEKVFLAQAYAHSHQADKAEGIFQSMNHKNCNYKHRLAYAQFLVSNNKLDDAKALVNLLYNETKLMDGFEKRNNSQVIKEIRDLSKKFT